MNKKFLSAILFGALMVTSTGTFVSCKDYDDDIKGLQTQIDANKNAIAELQKLVGSGNWVTNVAASGSDLVVTMSNGSTVTVAGVKGADGKDGVDGKNAAEWTIGTDGFWYMDGEKTDKVAVAQNGKDGKDGVTAPSPTIENGMWVVYNWDAEKGEFVKEVTDVPAAGTSAFAVKADGIWTLNVADENGEFVEIALPATSDSFVVSALSTYLTSVTFESAKWNPAISNKYYKEIVKAFPEVADIEKKSLLKQGGNLPVLVNPANVELTNEFNFSLQTIKGEILDVAVENPQKGLIGDYSLSNGYLYSRAAKTEDCIWTLSIDPAYDEEDKAYVSTEKYEPVALVVENAKGTVVKTAFAYEIKADDLTTDNVTVNGVAGQGKTSAKKVAYAESIDLFAQDSKTEQTPIALDNEYNGYYIIALADELEVEEMGLSIAEDGHTLNIANMPARELKKNVTLEVIALGLNGSVAQNTVTLTVEQEIAATTGWDDKEVTLKVNNDGTFTQNVLWDINALELTATQKKQLWDNVADATIEISYIDEEGKEQTLKTYTDLLCKKADGTTNVSKTAGKYSDWAKLGFTLNATDYLENEYNVLVKFTDGNSVIYSATATMIVKNPELGATYVKLVPGFVDENGVYQITGDYKTYEDQIIYSLENALILGKGATIVNIIDVDNLNYEEEGRDDEAFEKYPLITRSFREATWTFSVNKWKYSWENPAAEWTEAKNNQLYKTRNIRAMISLFGNEENVVPFDFQVEVKSEIYAEDAKTAITIDETKLVNEFGAINVSGNDIDESVIDIKAAITKAISVAGTDKGKTYSLFATSKATSTGGSNAVINYASPKTAGNYVLGTDGNIVELSLVEYLKMVDAFGTDIVTGDNQDDDDITKGEAKYKLTTQAWNLIWATASKYYTTAGNGIYWNKYTATEQLNKPVFDDKDKDDTNGDGTKNFLWLNTKTEDFKNADGTIDDVAKMAIYTAFKSKISFNNSSEAVAGTPGTAVDKKRDDRVASVTIKFNDPAVAKIYFEEVAENGVVFTDATGTDYSDITIKPVAEAPNSVTGGQVKVGMTLTIRDAWGMIMNVPFEVTVKTKK